MKRCILFLAANPVDTDRLALDQECADIARELRLTPGRDEFDFRSAWAVSVDDLMRYLNELQPAILHFSGHGSAGARLPAERDDRHRDIASPGHAKDAGIFLQEAHGSQYVSKSALARLVESASPATRLVVLNACYSAEIGDALRRVVDCVVGIEGAIADVAARSFAVAFYRALGNSRSLGNAVDQAVAALDAHQHHGARPVCLTRDGLVPGQLFLSTSNPRPQASNGGHVIQAPCAPPPPLTVPAPTAPNLSGVTGSLSTVDVAILTIRDDEFRAVLRVFPDRGGRHKAARREYEIRHADAGGGARYQIAVVRAVEQGNGEAQDAARDLIEDCSPRLVLVVGIAGGVPSDDVKLGDVVISTRILDFSVEARKARKPASYAVTGGPIDKALAAMVANLAAIEEELGDWTLDLPPQPRVTWESEGELYGPLEWQHDLRAKLTYHHPTGAGGRGPTYVTGPIASSDRLVKDPELVIPWLQTARNLLAIEMESGGVYRAVRERCPMLAIRGISDIVGLRRAEAWTKYACASAAAFTRGFLRTRPIEVGSVERNRALGQVDVQPLDTARGATLHTTGTPRTPAPEHLAGAPGATRATPGAEDYDLFVAHHPAYEASACALYDLLQPDIRVFLSSRSLGSHDRWEQAVPAAQRRSRGTVLLISSRADSAWYLGDDIITAIALHRQSPEAHRLLPVLLDPGITLPCALQHVEAIDMAAIGGLAGVAKQLRKRVAGIREQMPALPSASSTIGAASGDRGRREHFHLHERLCQLAEPLFEQIVLQAGVARASIARTAPLPTRVLEVALLAALDPALSRRVMAELDRRASWTRR